MATLDLGFTAERISKATLAGLKYTSTLARRVFTDVSKDFSADGLGSTVSIKRPSVVDPARTYGADERDAGTAITYSNIITPKISITLDRQIYNAVTLPDEVYTFDIKDAEREIAAPLAESVAEKINAAVVGALATVQAGLTKADAAAKGKYVGANGTTYDTLEALKAAGTTFEAYGVGTKVKAANLTAKTNEDIFDTIRYARRLLDDRGVSKMNRLLVVGSGWAQALLSQDNLIKANEAASDGALREAIIGRIHGFEVIEESSLDPYAAYAMSFDAVALALRAPRVPAGVSFGKSISMDGFSLRYIHDYDPDFLQDRAVVSVFAGAVITDAQRVVKLTGTEGFETKTAPVVVEGA